MLAVFADGVGCGHPVCSHPPLNHPRWIRLTRRQSFVALFAQLSQYRVHHSRRESMARVLCEFHTLINGGPRRYPIQMQKLKCAHPQGDQHFRIELCIWMFQEWPDAVVKLDLPAQHTHYERSCQIPIRF